ncbi:pilus assembly PilX family protein [Zooshikella ganghwensis]|nr:PilX N-terminal domain-containing pilus assembly protein [Zooshikella ganghwensis]
MRKEKGAVLIISLMILLLVSMISVAVFRGVNFNTKMVANYRDKVGAFEIAEKALKEGERVVKGWREEPSRVTVNSIEDLPGINNNQVAETLSPIVYEKLKEEDDWGMANKFKVQDNSAEYVIEYYGNDPDGKKLDITSTSSEPQSTFYRITVKSTGKGSNKVILQSVYKRSF